MYRLTVAARELKDVLLQLAVWAARWTVGEPDPAELDPDLLMLFMSRHLNVDRLPDRRVVLRFDLRGARRPMLWLAIRGRRGVRLRRGAGWA